MWKYISLPHTHTSIHTAAYIHTTYTHTYIHTYIYFFLYFVTLNPVEHSVTHIDCQ